MFRPHRTRADHTEPPRYPARRGSTRGQSLVEFAIVIPVLLTIVGGAVDVARVFQANNVLESATRNAAEFIATKSNASSAATDAATVVCAEAKAIPGYVASSTAPGGCSSPTVSVTSFTLSTTDPGASVTYPIAKAVVQTSVPFRTLFPYPLFTQGGAWTISSTQAYSIVQGR